MLLSALWTRSFRPLLRSVCPLCGAPSYGGEVCAGCDGMLDLAQLEKPDFTLQAEDIALPCRAVFSYEYEAVVKLLFFLKRDPDHAVLRYAAMRLMRVIDKTHEKTLFVSVPRSPSGLRENGFDQGALLAAQTVRLLNAPLADMSKRKHRDTCYTNASVLAARVFTREQKKLTAAQRAENRQKSLYIRPFYRPKKNIRRIVIVDDVITTGASILACAKHLQRLYPGVKLSALALATVPGLKRR